LRDQGCQLVTTPDQRSQPYAVEGFNRVAQLLRHLPDEVLGLINNFILHKICDSGVVDRLRKSISGIDKSQWGMLPVLAPGQALVSLTSMARPLLVSVDPTPSKLLYVE